jgi:hypothetical protein
MLNMQFSACLGIAAGTSLILAGHAVAGSGDDWTHFARTADRRSRASAVPATLQPPRWVLNQTAGSDPITFAGQAGIVTAGDRAFAVGRVHSQHVAMAVRIADGALLWMQPVPPSFLDSWATPAIDVRNGTVLIASGAALTALDVGTGVQRWRAVLARPVVNASPLVTGDLGPANRAFLTAYDGFGGNGRLYCINVDPFDAAGNPFQPGDVVWSVVLGDTSGNSPAYRGGVVYTASIGDSAGSGVGQVQAFDAASTAAPAPLWVFTNPLARGFFGGVTVHEREPLPGVIERYIFAASYSLYGGQFSANLVKISAADGSLVWSVPSNRTDATPIVLASGRVALSSGIRGFGSIPSIQLFEDHGSSAVRLWDSAHDSWTDYNNNGIMDPGEYYVVGGWTHQPLVAAAGAPRMIAGAIQAQTFAACNDLYIIDLDRHPSDPQFVAAHFVGAGSTPALAADGTLLTVGPGGLHALGRACDANCDGSTAAPALNVDDFMCFLNQFAAGSALTPELQRQHYANCDGSTAAPVLNVDDFLCFINRYAEGCP